MTESIVEDNQSLNVDLVFFVAAMLNLVQDLALLEAAGQTQQVSPPTSNQIC